MSSLETCIEMLLKQMRQINVRLRGQRFVVKMLIPNSAASKIIGRDGCHAREMAAQTGCRTSISRRNPGIQERVVLLVGEEHGLATGTKLVARKIQDDPHLAEHMHFSYDVELPLGSWDCCKTGPMEPRAELLSPEVARTLPKRNLVEYLHKAAPREILVRYRLLGSMRKILKMKTHEQVMEVVEQTWQTRRPGEGHMATVPASPAERSVDPAGMLPFYPVGLLPLQGGLSEISESKGEKKEADDSSQTTDTPSRYRSDNQDEDIKYPGLENDSQGVIDCARSLLDRAKDQAKTSKKMDCEEAKTAMGYVAATMMQLLKVVDAEKSDAEKLLEQLNIRILAWVFLSRLVKLAPACTREKNERRRAFLQIAWNASTLWKWFFVYCWVQQVTYNRARLLVAYPVSCLFFTLFHVGTQDTEYLKRAWFANTMLALPFNFFGLFAIWPLAAGAAGAVGTYTSQRFFTISDILGQLGGLALALIIGLYIM